MTEWKEKVANELAGWELVPILSKYAQEHRERTETLSVFWPAWGCWVSPPLHKDNGKIRGALIWDMTPVSTCPNCTDCRETCYALKEYIYPDRRNIWAIHEWMARHDVDFLGKAIMVQLARSVTTTVRIHGSGDFFSEEYIKMWERIAYFYNNITFYFYTKADEVFPEEIASLADLPNVNRVRSLLPHGELNYGEEDCIKKMLAKYKEQIALCPNYNKADIDPTTKRPRKYHCVSECTYCLTHEYVLIRRH